MIYKISKIKVRKKIKEKNHKIRKLINSKNKLFINQIEPKL